jgi:hypothetical protein
MCYNLQSMNLPFTTEWNIYMWRSSYIQILREVPEDGVCTASKRVGPYNVSSFKVLFLTDFLTYGL